MVIILVIMKPKIELDRVRYYTVNNDGRVTSDNKHTYAGFKPYYRTIMASAVVNNEFRGL